MIKNIANLIKVKTIVTFVMTAVFAVLALRGTIAPEMVMTIITMVFMFYFDSQHNKEGKNE
ncbi:MAG: hypothetical protein RSF40_02220 [Oscillospiraceae bacterium]